MYKLSNTTLSMIEKRKIAARAFYMDNKDQYEDYNAAEIEFMGEQKPPDSFVNTCVEPFIKMVKGCQLFTRNGFVVSFNPETDYTQFIGEVDREDVEPIHQEVQDLIDQNPDMDGGEAYRKLGWTEIIHVL